MTARIETTILRALLRSEQYARKVLPFIQQEYFPEKSDGVVFHHTYEFYQKYSKAPTKEALTIMLSQDKTLQESVAQAAHKTITEFTDEPLPAEDWMLSHTEKFCKERALFNGMMKGISIMEGTEKETTGAIPELLTKALAITFDPRVGHDYLEDANERYDYYHKVENKIKFDLDILNKVTNGGVTTATLNMLMGGIHVGKSAGLCHLAASYLSQGYNVLYITLEMSEKETAKRIDANLLNTNMDDIDMLPKNVYENRMSLVAGKTKGKLVIREFPTAGASVNHFRALINELFLKKNFKPQVILIDYINICASSRIKMGGSINTYSYVKSIAEEVRGLAKEFDVPIWSATQLNREGMKSSDPTMTDTSESVGLPATCDLLWILVRSEQLDNLGQLMIVNAKNRYRDIGKDPKFVIGWDRAKMRYHDVAASAQQGIIQNTQQATTTPTATPNNRQQSKQIGPTSGWKIS